jgi:hypothetical protein
MSPGASSPLGALELGGLRIIAAAGCPDGVALCVARLIGPSWAMLIGGGAGTLVSMVGSDDAWLARSRRDPGVMFGKLRDARGRIHGRRITPGSWQGRAGSASGARQLLCCVRGRGVSGGRLAKCSRLPVGTCNNGGHEERMGRIGCRVRRSRCHSGFAGSRPSRAPRHKQLQDRSLPGVRAEIAAHHRNCSAPSAVWPASDSSAGC